MNTIQKYQSRKDNQVVFAIKASKDDFAMRNMVALLGADLELTMHFGTPQPEGKICEYFGMEIFEGQWVVKGADIAGFEVLSDGDFVETFASEQPLF